MKKVFLTLSLLVMFSGCSISIILTDTHGPASDVVDETMRTDPDITTDVSIPANSIRSL